MSPFERMSQLVTVRDIFTPWGAVFDSDDSVGEAMTQLLESRDSSWDRPCLVQGDGLQGDGIFTPEEGEHYISSKDTIDLHMEEFGTSAMLSANTSVLESLELIGRTKADFYVVIDGNNMVGTLRFVDFMKPAGRLCLFALTMELEVCALELCDAFAEQCWRSLPTGRQKQAMEVFRRRHNNIDLAWLKKYRRGLRGRDLEHVFVDCTTMIDKATMIRKCKLTIASSGTELKEVFGRAERLRNSCAHPALVESEDGLMPLDDLVPLITACRRLIEAFKAITPPRASPWDE